jgi:glycosyltransferase involved in cell wall biosynthesis
MSLADVVILNSETVRGFAISGEGVDPHKIVVIPNGISVENYLAPVAREELRAQWNLPQEAVVLGSIGRLVPQKGFDVLLRALANLPNANVQLVLVGEGEQETALRALAAELRIAERVHFVGYRYDVPQLLGAFDVYVHPARFEGMSNAVLEAMAAGCPIVASAVDGNLELIQDGITGWLVPPDNVPALAHAMKEAITQPQEARERGRAAQQRALHCFSVDAMVQQWEKVLTDEKRFEKS